MSMSTIAILSPGDMGSAVAKVLRRHDIRVLTCLQNRSAYTKTLAAQAGIEDIPDYKTLLRESDLILSILPPSSALDLARSIASASQSIEPPRKLPLFADLNAISPSNAHTISTILNSVGIETIDGAIIGPPPKEDGTQPRIYVSGPRAQDLLALRPYGLDMRFVSTSIGAASGLKMCYASITKGLTALATEALTTAASLGLSDIFDKELKASLPGLDAMFARSVPGMCPKAYRWIGEMEQIADTFKEVGLPSGMLTGAAEVYKFVEQTELGNEEGRRYKRRDVREVAMVLANAAKAEKESSLD